MNSKVVSDSIVLQKEGTYKKNMTEERGLNIFS